MSEGQKGLLSMCSLILQKPSILILDEPTNHINFRHLKSLANAIKKFEGAVLLVSHDEEFVRNVDVTDTIDLGFQIKWFIDLFDLFDLLILVWVLVLMCCK